MSHGSPPLIDHGPTRRQGYPTSVGAYPLFPHATCAWGQPPIPRPGTSSSGTTYATPGAYTATVTETDSTGTSMAQVFTGQTVSNNGGPSAVSSQNFTVVPKLAMAFTTTSVPPGTLGTLCSTTLQASGGNSPYKWVDHLWQPARTFTVHVVDQKSTFRPHIRNTATSTLSLTVS